jgi:hypothetical protein
VLALMTLAVRNCQFLSLDLERIFVPSTMASRIVQRNKCMWSKEIMEIVVKGERLNLIKDYGRIPMSALNKAEHLACQN